MVLDPLAIDAGRNDQAPGGTPERRHDRGDRGQVAASADHLARPGPRGDGLAMDPPGPPHDRLGVQLVDQDVAQLNLPWKVELLAVELAVSAGDVEPVGDGLRV